MKNFKKYIKSLCVTAQAMCVLAAALPVQTMAVEGLPQFNSNDVPREVIDLDEKGNTKGLFILNNKITVDVYVNNEYSALLSDEYSYGDTAEIEAPATANDKNFSYWESDGSIISYNPKISFTVGANTELDAVYGKNVNHVDTVNILAVSNDDSGKILFDVFSSAGENAEIGIIYSKTVSEKSKLISQGTKISKEADYNGCCTLDFTPEDENDVYYVIPCSGGIYGDIKTVSFASTNSGVSAELADFDSGEDAAEEGEDYAEPEKATITKNPASKKLVYNNKPQELITAGKAENGIMQYSLKKESGYSADIPTGTEVGNYTVWYKVVGTGGYLSTEPKSVVSTISLNYEEEKVTQNFSVKIENYICDGTAHKPVIEGKTYGNVTYVYYNIDTNKKLSAPPTEPGFYKVRVVAAGDKNHYLCQRTAKYVILPKQTYSVSVVNGTIKGKTEGDFQPGTIIAVKSDAAPDGYKFGFWKRNGLTASYNSVYTFPVSADNIQLEAVYLEADDQFSKNGNCAKEAVIIDDKSISFSFLYNVPENCNIVKCGIVATSDTKQANELSVEKNMFMKEKVTSAHNYKYTWTKSNVTDNQTWYVKAYLTYKDADGKEYIMYSDMEKATLNGSQTIREEKVVGVAAMDSVVKDAENKTIDFNALLNVPADCTVKFAGIVATSDETKIDSLTEIDAAEKTEINNCYVRGMTSTKHTVKFNWTKTKVGTETWYVRPYLVYTDSLGSKQIVFGELTAEKLS